MRERIQFQLHRQTFFSRTGFYLDPMQAGRLDQLVNLTEINMKFAAANTTFTDNLSGLSIELRNKLYK